MKTKKKILVLALAMILVAAASVAGTLAWLTDKTETKKNTFTVGNIDIELAETETDDVFEVSDNEYSFKMVPGKELDKDPVVTVKKGSEDCWVFVKLDKVNDPDKYLDYSFYDCWTELTGVAGVYYLNNGYSSDTSNDESFHILKDDQVVVKESVDKAMMDALATSGSDSFPQLVFTAYAVQKEGVSSAADAWNIASGN